MVGQFGPAVRGQLAVFRIQADNDVPRKFQADIGNEVGRGHRAGADNHVVDPHVQVGLDRVFIPNPAAGLDFNVGMRFGDVVDNVGIHGASGNRPVKIDDVQPFCPGLDPFCRHRHRVVVVDGFFAHISLAQTHTFAVLYINRGN